MRYKATHSTRYRYDAVVSQCQSEVRLTPRALPWQALLESRIQATPEPAAIEAHKDYFGNDVTTFTILESHDRFTIVSTSTVDVEPRPAPPATDTPWEAVRDELAAHTRPETLEAFEYVFDSPFVIAGPELAAYGRKSFPAGRGVLEGIEDLAHRIHSEFTYEPNATSIDTPLLETLKARRGVCQDFSHVMIGALRSLHLSARYVSGYLRSGADYQGAEASHAWVSVYLPGSGWLDIDPTNDLRPGTGHVTLGWGRDYGDVSPIRGVILGGGAHSLRVHVDVVRLDT